MSNELLSIDTNISCISLEYEGEDRSLERVHLLTPRLQTPNLCVHTDVEKRVHATIYMVEAPEPIDRLDDTVYIRYYRY